jgi:hypothetical protein
MADRGRMSNSVLRRHVNEIRSCFAAVTGAARPYSHRLGRRALSAPADFRRVLPSISAWRAEVGACWTLSYCCLREALIAGRLSCPPLHSATSHSTKLSTSGRAALRTNTAWFAQVDGMLGSNSRTTRPAVRSRCTKTSRASAIPWPLTAALSNKAASLNVGPRCGCAIRTPAALNHRRHGSRSECSNTPLSKSCARLIAPRRSR